MRTDRLHKAGGGLITLIRDNITFTTTDIPSTIITHNTELQMVKVHINSYLTGRTQYVVYDGHKSSTLNMTCGVPQGSILGLLLFIIHVNDICNVSDLLFEILYADDTGVVAQGHNLEDLIDTLNTELSSLNEWLLCNKLSLNTNKTYYMVFHRARIKLTNIDIGINGSKLLRIKCVKYLGLMVDQKRKWIDHMAHVKH